MNSIVWFYIVWLTFFVLAMWASAHLSEREDAPPTGEEDGASTHTKRG